MLHFFFDGKIITYNPHFLNFNTPCINKSSKETNDLDPGVITAASSF